VPKYITDPANEEYDFGQGFNYAVWTEGTIVTLTNVLWNNDYRDVCEFPDAHGRTLDEYIDSNESENIAIQNISYLKFNVPIRINIPFNKAFKFNYLRVQNPLQPVPGSDVLKSYYYFILDAKYIAPNTTELTIQLDIFQSFRTDFQFGNCYIERGHIGIANENAFDNFGRDYLAIPEGLDIGGEYQIAHATSTVIMTDDSWETGNSWGPSEGTKMNILVVSTVNLEADPGSITDPHLYSAPGSDWENVPSGASYYVWENPTLFSLFMQSFADKPWITQGIVSITGIPPLARYGVDVSFTDSPAEPYWGMQKLDGIDGMKANPVFYQAFPNWRESDYILNAFPERYRGLKKLLTYPYMVIELTTFTGQPIIVKPESWNDANAAIMERFTPLPPNQRISFHPFKYNAITGSKTQDLQGTGNVEDGFSGYPEETNGVTFGKDPGGDDSGEYLDTAVIISAFPTFAIVNNMGIAFLASNAHGIAFQYQNADWAQNRALRGNEVTYDQNNKGIQASKNINQLQNSGVGAQAAAQNLLLSQQQAVSGIGGVITSAAQAGLGVTNGTVGLGGIAGAVGNEVMGSINLGNQQDQNTRAANITQQVSKSANTVQNTQAGYVNDTNKSLADWAARGDYENSVAGINAKVQDARLTQPSVSGQAGGETLNLITTGLKLSLRFKTIDPSAIKVVGEYWLRYGYAVRKFSLMPDSLMVMSKFTYWKLLETYIISSTMPEGFKQIIRGIFEKGVTVWADPSYIGVTDIADNEPLGGIAL